MDPWPKTFVKELCDDWNERNGLGSAPGTVIAGQFRRLRRVAPWHEVRLAWRRYLKREQPRWHSPGAFCNRWRSWLEPQVTATALAVRNALEDLHDAGGVQSGHDPAGRALPERGEGRG